MPDMIGRIVEIFSKYGIIGGPKQDATPCFLYVHTISMAQLKGMRPKIFNACVRQEAYQS